MTPAYVVLDFDGTVTRVDQIADSFLEAYRQRLAEATRRPEIAKLWPSVADFVRTESPRLGWKFGGWEVAPAGADPYIFASTTAELLLEQAGLLDAYRGLPSALYGECYALHDAKFRAETNEVVDACLDSGARVAFISNAGSDKLKARLEAELGPQRFARIKVVGDAGKFFIRELPDSAKGAALHAPFSALSIGQSTPGLARPVLLRRGRYYGALSALWGADPEAAARTLVCGDIYELDLALPAALGCSVHLVEREEPHPTYAYERDAIAALGERGGVGPGFRSLLDRLA